jgi:hypothetical protein
LQNVWIFENNKLILPLKTTTTTTTMARRKIHFKTKREAMAYYDALDLYTQQQMRVFKRSPKHYVVCNSLEWLHFYGG